MGKPLYLRGFPIGDDLQFDGEGTLRNPSATAPFSLSGMDVTSVEEHGKSLILHGVRVALVSTPDAGPGLHRKRITSTTLLFESLRRGDKRRFKAEEQIRITVRPDHTGGYDTALKRVFLDGEAALADAVPSYWPCYAEAYFRQTPTTDAPESSVQRCVTHAADGTLVTPSGAEAGQPPRLATALSPNFPQRDADLGIGGTAKVHLVVRKDGTPVGLQIVQALGGGMDEAILQALSLARFQPAMKDGSPVDAGMDLQFSVAPPSSP